MLHSDALNERLLNEVFELGRELRPVAGDLLAEEHGGELPDVGGLSGAKMLNESRHHLGVLGQALYLLLRLTSSVVVRHQELYQQQLQRLRHVVSLSYRLFSSRRSCSR